MIGPGRADARRFIAYRPAATRQRSLLLLRCSIGIFTLEAFHTARCVDQLLLTREKRVAARANFHAYQFTFVRRARLKCAPAGAMHLYGVVIGMYPFFHVLSPAVGTGLRVLSSPEVSAERTCWVNRTPSRVARSTAKQP